MTDRKQNLPLSGILFGLALMAWFGLGVLLARWHYEKPSAPDQTSDEVIPYANHGVMYVTQLDLYISRGMWVCAIGLFLAGILAQEIERSRGSRT